MSHVQGYAFLRGIVTRRDGASSALISRCCPTAAMLASFCATTTNPKPSRKGQRGPAAPQANKSKRSGKGRQQQPAHVSESRHKQQAPATRSNQLLASSLAARTAPKGGTSQLHDELIDFAWRCAPTPASIKLSELSARAIELAWSRCSSGPAIRAVPFGSQPCAVALPGADLDLYVESVEVSHFRPCPYPHLVPLQS